MFEGHVLLNTEEYQKSARLKFSWSIMIHH